MKKLIILSMAVLSAAALFSCQKTEVAPFEENSKLAKLTCVFPKLASEKGSKVTLASTGKAQWEADVDAIVFQGCPNGVSPVTHTFTSAELSDPEKASFSVDLSGLVADEGMNQEVNVAYPAEIWSPYSSSHMYGRSSFSNTNRMLMAGYVDGASVTLFHMTAAITFQVPGTLGDYDSYVFKGNNEEVVGYSKLLVEVNNPNVTSYRKKYKTSAPYGSAGPLTSVSGSVVSDGSTVNTVFLPVNTKNSADEDNENGANTVYLPSGFTIQLLKGDVIKKYITSTKGLTLTPGHMINLGLLPAGNMHDYVPPTTHNNTIGVTVGTATDLSATAAANCYMIDGSAVAANAEFKFKAQKGKGGAIITDFNSTEAEDVVVLWETKNTSTAPSVGDIIAAVDYDLQDGEDAYIVFKMPATITPGNALIAARNGSGNIVWSWHIWIPATTVGTTNDATNFGATIMNRNLGALVDATTDTPSSPESYGMLYQWGRKDPFPGLGVASGSTAAAVAGTAMTYYNGHLSVEETYANPTKFAYNAEADWNTETNGSLWAEGSKTVYDPCPPGYKVPARASSTFWGGSTLIGVAGFTQYDANYSFELGSVIIPLAGYIDDAGDSHKKAGLRTILWTGRYDSGTQNAYGFYGYLDSGGPYFKRTSIARSRGGSVRCVVE